MNLANSNFVMPFYSFGVGQQQQFLNFQNPFLFNMQGFVPQVNYPFLNFKSNNNTKSQNTTSLSNNNQIQKKPKADISAEFLTVANKYSKCKESDGSHLKFCINDGCTKKNSGEWCTDFVTYVAKESFRNKGLYPPIWFGSHDVEQLKLQSIANNKFISTTNKNNKKDFIANHIKPGDIMILNENGASHCGFVTEVNKDGSFKTIEGNRYDKVDTASYDANENSLSGFIRLSI